jgi:hypothetical protein
MVRFIGTCTFKIKMDLESIVLYLNKKDLAAVKIHTEINHVLGQSTIGYSTVTRYLHKQSFSYSLTLPSPQRNVKSMVPTQLTMLLCKRLTNSLCFMSSDYQEDLGSDVNYSISFGE